jgi:hypothetical protein
MVGFELYPWHSKAVTRRMQPPAEVVRKYVWEPVAELGAPVFAFGASVDTQNRPLIDTSKPAIK